MKLLHSELYIDDIKKAICNTELSCLDGKSIFITGGLGLLCSAIVDVLLIYGKTGKIYVGARNIKQFQERFDGDKVVFVLYDALERLNLKEKPDYIIHGAGLSSPELYTSKPVETLLSNLDGVHNLLEFARENSGTRLLYISSSEVYGQKDTEGQFKEGIYGVVDIDNTRSSYSVAKRSSEMLCKAYCSEYGVDIVIVRPGHIYGPSAKRTDKRVASDFMFKAASGQKIEMKSAGIQKRSYCYSVDCAIQVLTALIKGKSGQAYNIGHDEVTTIREMAQIAANAGAVELSISEPTEIEIKAFNPMNNSSLNNDKIKKLGYQDTFSVEQGIWHTVQIIKETMS